MKINPSIKEENEGNELRRLSSRPGQKSWLQWALRNKFLEQKIKRDSGDGVKKKISKGVLNDDQDNENGDSFFRWREKKWKREVEIWNIFRLEIGVWRSDMLKEIGQILWKRFIIKIKDTFAKRHLLLDFCWTKYILFLNWNTRKIRV